MTSPAEGLPDVARIVAALRRHDVDYILVGGSLVAVIGDCGSLTWSPSPRVGTTVAL
ncbi:MAG: hypothetical protein ACT4OS_02000 [Acidimicrobiales bacterium]